MKRFQYNSKIRVCKINILNNIFLFIVLYHHKSSGVRGRTIKLLKNIRYTLTMLKEKEYPTLAYFLVFFPPL